MRDPEGAAAPAASSTCPRLPAGPAPGEPGRSSPRRLRTSSEVILTAAIVGAEITRAQTPHLPITAQEIADEAARCREAGAAVIHLHVRNDDGSHTQSRERFAEAIDAIREKTDCIMQTSTGGAVGMSIDERAQPARSASPEMATLNCGTINFGDDVFVNTRPHIRDLAARIREAGSVPELECYEVGHVEEALALAAEGRHRARRSTSSSCSASRAASARARRTCAVHAVARARPAPPGAWPRSGATSSR